MKIIVYATTGYMGCKMEEEIDLIEYGFSKKELEIMSKETRKDIDELSDDIIANFVESGWYKKDNKNESK